VSRSDLWWDDVIEFEDKRGRTKCSGCGRAVHLRLERNDSKPLGDGPVIWSVIARGECATYTNRGEVTVTESELAEHGFLYEVRLDEILARRCGWHLTKIRLKNRRLRLSPLAR
jgi:hypothetical protein